MTQMAVHAPADGPDRDQMAILQRLEAYDAAEDTDGLHAYLQTITRVPESFENFAEHFLLRKRFYSAFLIGAAIIADPYCGPVAALAYGIGELVCKPLDAAIYGPLILSSIIDRHSEDEQLALYHSRIDPIFRVIIIFGPNSELYQSRWRIGLINLVKASAPKFRRIFDFTKLDELNLPLSDIVSRGMAKADLISFSGYDRRQDLPTRKAVIALRARVNSKDPDSRQLTEGARLLNACKSAGWTAELLDVYGIAGEDYYLKILLKVIGADADILILDEDFMRPVLREATLHLIGLIKGRLPDLKIVGFIFDPWLLGAKAAEVWADTFDLFWSLSPDFLSHHPPFSSKGFFAPFPHGGDYGGPILPLKSRVSFVGSISAYNWHRTLWRAAAEEFGLPIDIRQTSHRSDGLPVMESYLSYMRAIGDSTVSINFAMRNDLSLPITGRAFETLTSGALLIQENCPELDRYIIPGRHYLPFTTFHDLCAVINFVISQPSQAEEIRRSGNAFMREVYSDQKIIEYLDRRLYPN